MVDFILGHTSLPTPPMKRRKMFHEYYKLADALASLPEEYDHSTLVLAKDRLRGDAVSKCFMTSSFDEMRELYFIIEDECRHYYEVILPSRPSKLYFDIEFQRRYNPRINNAAAQVFLDALILFVLQKLKEKFPLQLGEEIDLENAYKYVLDLDSSTASKFSHHLVFNLPATVAFENNLAVGAFVSYLVNEAKSMPVEELTRRNLQNIFVRNERREATLMIDMGVYTRNRLFRLFFSSKMSVDRHKATVKLVLAERSRRQYERHSDGNDSGAIDLCRVLSDSLITYLDRTQLKILRSDGLHMELRTTSGVERCGPVMVRPKTSQYKSLDAFILSVIQTPSTPHAYVRKVLPYKREGHTNIVFDIEGWRYCWRVGRQHKANHVMIVVHLVPDFPDTSRWFQRCHDPDCRAAQYCSAMFELPPAVMRELREELREREKGEENGIVKK